MTPTTPANDDAGPLDEPGAEAVAGPSALTGQDLEENKRRRLRTARLATNGTTGTILACTYLKELSPDPIAVGAVIDEMARALAEGDPSHIERMLVAQAVGLQAVVSDLAIRAKGQTTLSGTQTLLGLAFKGASEVRKTLVAAREVRTPRTVTFARQANMTTGPQQINNNGGALQADAARARDGQSRPVEESGGGHVVHQNAGASSTAGGAYPKLAAVGEVHRADLTRGQGEVSNEQLQGRTARSLEEVGGRGQRGAAGAARTPGPAEVGGTGSPGKARKRPATR